MRKRMDELKINHSTEFGIVEAIIKCQDSLAEYITIRTNRTTITRRKSTKIKVY